MKDGGWAREFEEQEVCSSKGSGPRVRSPQPPHVRGFHSSLLK